MTRTLLSILSGAVLASALSLPALAAPASPTPALDLEIERFRDELRASCEPDRVFRTTEDFARIADLNADGVADAVLSTQGASCEGAPSRFLGPHQGYDLRFVLSLPDGGYGRYDADAQSVDIVTGADGIGVRLGFHGSYCGRAGHEACAVVLAFVADEAFDIDWPHGHELLDPLIVEIQRERLAAARMRVSRLDAPATGPVIGARSVYSDTSGPTCRDVVEHDELGIVACEGPEGRAFEIVDTGLRLGARFSQLDDGMELEPPYAPSGAGIGGKIEWRLAPDGRPFATIYRAFTTKTPKGGRERQVLVVTKIDGPLACHVAYVDAHRDGANERARTIADTTSSDFHCGRDTPIRDGDVAFY